MKNSLFAVLLSLMSAPVFAASIQDLTFNCNYPQDVQRGVQVVRMAYTLESTQHGIKACMEFFEYSPSKSVRGKSCGDQNKTYGMRKDAFGIDSYRFDGYLDYAQESGNSLPSAKKRRFAIFQMNTAQPTLILRTDNRTATDIEYVCVKSI